MASVSGLLFLNPPPNANDRPPCRAAGLPGCLARGWQAGLLMDGRLGLRGHCIMSDKVSASPETQRREQQPGQLCGTAPETRVRDAEERGQGESSLGRTASKNAPLLSAPLMLANAPRISWLLDLRRRWSGLCTAWKRGARQGCKRGPDQAKKRDDKRLE